ncbi:hypothetical protein Tco_0704034 [Tanacetum coccineum]|uniref:Uncharacterized protein n=1 Tax=Tanacetum coccineum TaxID=301880 RepID=A0ABQ4Y2H2_9ASTR
MGVEGISNMALSPCEVGLDWDGDGFVLCCRGDKGELAASAPHVVCCYCMDSPFGTCGETDLTAILAVTRKTLKGRKKLRGFQTRWKINMGNVLDSCNQWSIQQCMKSLVAKHLGVPVIQQQNGLVEETNVTLLAKVKCILLGYYDDMDGCQLWRLDEVTSKVVLYGNKVFNKSGEHMKTFISYSGVRHREQHSARELFRYREDNDEAAFAVAALEKINAHESLIFNDIVSYEVISKWNDGLKEDMDARVYNGKSVQTFLEGHSILSLEVSLSGDYDVEKNSLCGFDYAMGRSITVMGRSLQEAVKEAIWLKGLLTKSGAELRLVAVGAIDALIEVVHGPRFNTV